MDRSTATVHVVDDDPDLLNSLQALLGSVDLRVRAYASAHAFLDSYDPDVPGCLVLDVHLPDMSGLELQEHLRRKIGHVPVIMIADFADVATAVRGMKNGALDFLQKPFNAQVLLERVEQALREGDRERKIQQEQAADQALMKSLTGREAEVVDLVVAGHANKQIARLLGISQKTVELHRSKAMRKVGASHVADLVALVFRLRGTRRADFRANVTGRASAFWKDTFAG